VEPAHHGILHHLDPSVRASSLQKLRSTQYRLHTMSPHTTLCLCSPLLVLSVKKPSLPATSSLQSRASSFEIKPASSTCAAFNPKVTHFPIRRFRSDNHREFKGAVAASAPGGSEALRGAVANDRMESVS